MRVIVDPRAPYHEAGHALVAKKINIRLLGVGSVEGHPGKLGTAVMNESEKCNPIFCAGGIAAELILFGSYDPEGSISDRASISAAGASLEGSIQAARALLDRDELISIAKRIESFVLQHEVGYLTESGLFESPNASS